MEFFTSSKILKDLLYRTQLNAQKIGQKIGISQQTISRIINKSYKSTPNCVIYLKLIFLKDLLDNKKINIFDIESIIIHEKNDKYYPQFVLRSYETN